MGWKKLAREIGVCRERFIVDMMVKHWRRLGFNVYVFRDNSKGKLDRLKQMFKKHMVEDCFTVAVKGVTINWRSEKPLDIIVFKDGKIIEVWEITNYDEDSWMTINKFLKYIDRLKMYKFDCQRYLVVSSPNNFRRLDFHKTPKENIEWAENRLREEGVNLIYWGKQNKLKKEIEGWIDA